MNDRIYFCIDLKSFYASVECVERGLDSLLTNLVVADASRGNGSICLAVSAHLRSLGVRNRCRLFEIPQGLDYIIAKPRMKKYIEYSTKIYKIYQEYFSFEDIFVYSIDECFIDITSYVALYKMEPICLAKKLQEEVLNRIGICASCGIGTNMFLAKVAMDIEAKKNDSHVAFLDQRLFREKMWNHRPITDFWNIGPGTKRRLESIGIYDMEGIAHADKRVLYKLFGVDAVHLINHASGIEETSIKECLEYKPTTKQISNSQILFRDYNYAETLLVLKEMIDLLVLKLIKSSLVTSSVGVFISYSKNIVKSTGGSLKLGLYTSSTKIIKDNMLDIFYKTTNKDYPIRRISICFSNVADKKYKTISLFTNEKFEAREENLNMAIVDIKDRFGKNSILKAMNLFEEATTIKRNKLIGGHNAE